MKKLLTLFLTAYLILAPLNFIFADEIKKTEEASCEVDNNSTSCEVDFEKPALIDSETKEKEEDCAEDDSNGCQVTFPSDPKDPSDPLHNDDSCDGRFIEIFVKKDCPVCKAQKEFLEELKKEMDCHVVFLNIYENQKLYQAIDKKFETVKGNPITPVSIAGNTIIVGFNKNYTPDKLKKILTESKEFHSFQQALDDPEVAKKIKVERVGIVSLFGIEFNVENLRKKSLSLLAIVLGFVDGFNPCAMWVLVMFLVALVQMGDRTKMFIMAGTFMVAEAVMYALILTSWLTMWGVIGFDKWVMPIVAVISICAAGFFLWEGIFSDGTCKVSNVKQRQKISTRIQKLAASPMNWGFIVGVLALAFSVNMIEFLCSIGIPQTFTKILDISDVSSLHQIWLVFIYIVFYMVDDFVVFGIALYAIEKIGVTHKYAKISNIIGGSVMLILGLLLLLKPEWLSFNF